MMSDIKYGKIVDLVHLLVKDAYKDKMDAVFVDATAGNGNDTLFLCQLAKNSGKVYAFDVQQLAIEHTKQLLNENMCHNCEIIMDSHANIEKYVREDKIDCVLFNLGYLPNSDKTVKTQYESTIQAIKIILNKLSDIGRIFISAYIGHDNGEEANHVLKYLETLNKKYYNVIQIKLINKSNSPPQIYIVEKCMIN